AIAVAFRELNELDSALHYYQVACEKSVNDPQNTAYYYNGLGLIEMKRENWGQAEAALQTAREAAELSGSVFLPETMYLFGKLYNQRGDYSKALSYLQTSSEQVSNLPGLPTMQNGITLLLLREEFLANRAMQYQAQPSNSTLLAWYEEAIQTFEFLQAYRSQFSAPENQRTANSLQPNLISEILEAIYERYLTEGNKEYLKIAYEVIESNKGIVLLQALKQADIRTFPGISQEQLRLETSLRQQLVQAEVKKKECCQDISCENIQCPSLDQQINTLNDRLDSLLSIFQKANPAYFQAVHDLSPLPLAELQQTLLAPGESLVEYALGEERLFILLVQQGRVLLRRVPLTEDVEQLVKQFHNESITYRFMGDRSFRPLAREDSFPSWAHRLYQILWQPIEDEVGERVVIVPDGILGQLPFGALLRQPSDQIGDYPNYEFLGLHHNLSYNYSAKLWQQMQHRNRIIQRGILAMAPFTDQSLREETDSLGLKMSQLPESQTEVATLQGLFPQTAVFVSDQATKTRFKELASSQQILHLSTHGVSNDVDGDFAYLTLAGNTPGTYAKVYGRELYSLQIPSELVVLSACETALGELQSNEGVVGLGRAFAYAGTKRVIMTLWSIRDSTTQLLMEEFYQGVKVGLPPQDALWQAKKQFVSKHRKFAAPYFWAGFIGLGAMDQPLALHRE
ncbi:MAG: CHAT domain-containing tetratricopeptide repeat protein, partial [Bacteroidota bacterium]